MNLKSTTFCPAKSKHDKYSSDSSEENFFTVQLCISSYTVIAVYHGFTMIRIKTENNSRNKIRETKGV